ncbi:MAG: hypothetical protein R3335_05225, partial [Anaerolineales bacterium]|nr:hypothetical protein [Anaerolineales bacterium]
MKIAKSYERLIHNRWGLLALYAGAAAVSLGLYIALSAGTSGLGFPLDDAWIHQTYARNLALRGEWAFFPGVESAGSTSPAWAVFLGVGYLLAIRPEIFAAFLGWITLIALAYVANWGFRSLAPGYGKWGPIIAVLLVFEWHLVWAAGSGMETLFAGLIITTALLWLLEDNIRWPLFGLLIGFGFWVRPDIVTLLGPALLALLLGNETAARKAIQTGQLLLGFGLLGGLYFGFNLVIGGALWPNTFYAKQAEYQVLQELPFWQRYLDEAFLPMVGVGILVLPGFILMLAAGLNNRRWPLLAGIIWWFGYIGLYAWRLPVTYQHGRYLMPAMPIYFIWGAAGLALLIAWMTSGPSNRALAYRAAGKVWGISAGIVLGFFWVLGARSFSQDIGVIETEMVAV